MRYLLYISAIELCLLGSGQALGFHGLTLRMVIFLILVTYHVVTNNLTKTSYLLTAAFTLTHIFAAFIGLNSGASLALILTDIKPLLFFLYIIPICSEFRNIKNTEIIVKTLRYSSLLLGVLYIVYCVFLREDTVIQLFTYHLQEINELFFRQDGFFFYKGFLYLSVGLFLFFFSESRIKYLALVILLSAIFLTFTRGLILAVILAPIVLFILDIIITKKIKKRYLVLTIIAISSFIAILPIVIELFGDKSTSDGVRFVIIEEVFDAVNPISFIFGHGLGVGIPSKPVHMEIAILELLHKQGIIGILFWTSLLFISIFNYSMISKENRYFAKPFLLIIIAVYIISLTNPFLNNPIGMFPFLCAFTVIKYEKDLGLYPHI